jgi:hypothetical protein
MISTAPANPVVKRSVFLQTSHVAVPSNIDVGPVAKGTHRQ